MNRFWKFLKKQKRHLPPEDPNFNRMASRVKDMYHGYKYIYRAEAASFYQVRYDYGPGGVRFNFQDSADWCRENLIDKFRVDFLRVIQDSYNDEWYINEIGGGDYVFFAFMNEQDYLWFRLKWE